MIFMNWFEAVLFIVVTAGACYVAVQLCWKVEERAQDSELEWRYEDTMRRARETLDDLEDVA